MWSSSGPITIAVMTLVNYLAGSKSVSARLPVRPPIRPGYDDKYRSRSYCVIEQQKFFLKSYMGDFVKFYMPNCNNQQMHLKTVRKGVKRSDLDQRTKEVILWEPFRHLTE